MRTLFSSQWLKTEARLNKSFPITPSTKEHISVGDTRNTFMFATVGSAAGFLCTQCHMKVSNKISQALVVALRVTYKAVVLRGFFFFFT